MAGWNMRIMQANKSRWSGTPAAGQGARMMASHRPRSNVRWCTDHFELSSGSGEIVRVRCDREIIAWSANGFHLR